MSVQRTYYCDGPDCGAHATTATPPPYLPTGFLGVVEHCPGGNAEYQFCGWECAMKYGSSRPAPEFIDWRDVPPEEAG